MAVTDISVAKVAVLLLATGIRKWLMIETAEE